MDITVSSIMLSKIVTCNSTCNLKKVAQKIIDEDAGSVLIKKEEELTGLITEKDLLRAILKNKDFETTQASEVMSSHLDCCNAEDSLEKCMELFEETKRYQGIEKLSLKEKNPFRYERAYASLRGALVSARETALHETTFL